jgi:ABC-2 type transport system permease protein
MTTHAPVLAAAPAARPARPAVLRIYRAETRAEILKMLRLPAYLIPTFAFPLMFYALFGISFGAGKSYGEVGVATYLLATYGAFGVIGVALFGFGVGLAVERGQGWMLLKRASPMPVGAFFAAKVTLAILLSIGVVIVLAAAGVLFGDVAFEPARLGLLGAVLVAGAAPFCAFGLMLGHLAGPNSAPAIVNLIHLPTSFASGLWIPIQALPDAVQKVAPALPAFHYGQLALETVGAGDGRIVQHVLYLLGFTAVCLTGAAVAYLRDDGRTFG